MDERVLHLVGIPHSECGCLELARRAAALFGLTIPDPGHHVIAAWKCGTDMTQYVPECAESDGHGEPGDVALLGPEGSGTVVDNLAVVVDPGLVLATTVGGRSRIVELSRLRASLRSIRRLPRC